jgi:hypothetical protein
MRCILGLCVVLAVGNPAWTTETDLVSLEQASQVRSVVSQTAPTSGVPAVTAPSITNMQQAPTQPAQTNTTPAPAMTTSNSTTAGTQPGATTTSNTMAPVTYYYRTGIFGRRYQMATPVYSGYTTYTYTTAGNSTPTQTNSTVPQQEVYYQPVQQRRGLLGIFQPRWRQQVMPVYTTPGYTTTGSANTVFMTPGYTPVTYYYYSMPAGTVPATVTPPGMVSSGTAPVTTTPTYTPTMYTTPSGTTPAAATSTSTAPAAATTPTGTIPSVVTPPAPSVRLPR